MVLAENNSLFFYMRIVLGIKLLVVRLIVWIQRIDLGSDEQRALIFWVEVKKLVLAEGGKEC